MMMNLFSSFDPSCNLFFSMNFFILFLSIFFPPIFWIIPSRYTIFLSMILVFLKKEFFLMMSKKLFGGSIIYIVLFFYVLEYNILGMLPYLFTMTSQLNFNLFFSLIFFFIFFFMGWFKLYKIMFCHLTPLSSPLILSPFLVLIESISMLIRPLTLSVRLTANIVSGHILMEIILGPSGKFMFILSLIYFLLVLPILILEIMVCFVQSFVISSLSSLYLGEILSH